MLTITDPSASRNRSLITGLSIEPMKSSAKRTFVCTLGLKNSVRPENPSGALDMGSPKDLPPSGHCLFMKASNATMWSVRPSIGMPRAFSFRREASAAYGLISNPTTLYR